MNGSVSEELSNFWLNGGPLMYPIALLGVVGLVLLALSSTALTTPQGSRRAVVMSTVLWALGVAILGLSAVAWLLAMRNVELAVATVNPADRDTLLAAGRAEARSLLILGLVSALPALVGGIALLGFGLTRLSRYSGAPKP